MVPTPTEIKSARTAARLTQAEAAKLAGYGAQSRWAEIEAGRKPIDPVRWQFFLHVAGIQRMPFRKR